MHNRAELLNDEPLNEYKRTLDILTAIINSHWPLRGSAATSRMFHHTDCLAKIRYEIYKSYNRAPVDQVTIRELLRLFVQNYEINPQSKPKTIQFIWQFIRETRIKWLQIFYSREIWDDKVAFKFLQEPGAQQDRQRLRYLYKHLNLDQKMYIFNHAIMLLETKRKANLLKCIGLLIISDSNILQSNYALMTRIIKHHFFDTDQRVKRAISELLVAHAVQVDVSDKRYICNLILMSSTTFTNHYLLVLDAFWNDLSSQQHQQIILFVEELLASDANISLGLIWHRLTEMQQLQILTQLKSHYESKRIASTKIQLMMIDLLSSRGVDSITNACRIQMLSLLDAMSHNDVVGLSWRAVLSDSLQKKHYYIKHARYFLQQLLEHDCSVNDVAMIGMVQLIKLLPHKDRKKILGECERYLILPSISRLFNQLLMHLKSPKYEDDCDEIVTELILKSMTTPYLLGEDFCHVIATTAPINCSQANLRYACVELVNLIFKSKFEFLSYVCPAIANLMSQLTPSNRYMLINFIKSSENKLYVNYILAYCDDHLSEADRHEVISKLMDYYCYKQYEKYFQIEPCCLSLKRMLKHLSVDHLIHLLIHEYSIYKPFHMGSGRVGDAFYLDLFQQLNVKLVFKPDQSSWLSTLPADLQNMVWQYALESSNTYLRYK